MSSTALNYVALGDLQVGDKSKVKGDSDKTTYATLADTIEILDESGNS